jgi:subtilase family serine protease
VFGDLRGWYYLIVVVDATNVVAESDEKNNVAAFRYEFPCGSLLNLNFCIPR